ncbi:Glycine betaine transporter BetP [Arthrobacter saudimassiliensis]|uniref:Glycine betaine transporter BetP n=1 Tax=Arthrobacter saudimassiliensis TaxID=1461584 RepID=A0A078MTY7_9MICC|nr:Glycine betaine transporter BetP [Arthrobacter saudimassiliensis]
MGTINDPSLASPTPGSDPAAAESAPHDPAADTPVGHERDQEILGQLLESEAEVAAQQDEPIPARLDRTIFAVAGVLTLAFILWGFLDSSGLGTASTAALNWVMENTGWLFVLLASFFVLYVLWLALGRFGRIPLGRDGEAPEFRTWSWISMMFAAGMGIGLMFYGVAEPLYYYLSPPPGTVEGQSAEAIETALATSMFHWGLHPWAMYGVIGIAMAYGSFRLGRSQLISSLFTSLFGKRTVEGPVGKVLNIFGIFATLFGTAASLGLGALQIGSGIQSTGWFGDVGTPILVAIIAALTACFVASALSGISRGIQWLSNINMVLAVVLALVVFVAGPTLFILNVMPSALGSYAAEMADMAARTEATGGDALREWLSSWTIFYWAWWLSWTPFVGLFIARISRGRTIRQFVTGVLLVPTAVSLVWFSIFGGGAIGLQRSAEASGAEGLATMADGELSISFDGALFTLLDALPLPNILAAAVSVLAMVLVAIFFVTGADSASLVMATLSSNGSEKPSRGVVVFWGLLTGAVAAVMLLAGGDQPSEALDGLQNITIVAALPFAIVMLLLCVALYKDLSRDPRALRRELALSVVERTIRSGVEEHKGEPFNLVTSPPDTAPASNEADDAAPDAGPAAGTPEDTRPGARGPEPRDK